MLRTSVTPDGTFLVAVHRPSLHVVNLREHDFITSLGSTPQGDPFDNRVNFPKGDISVSKAKWIYEIANPFPFRGTTYIESAWADSRRKNPDSLELPPARECSVLESLKKHMTDSEAASTLTALPIQVLYGLAANSTDPEELVHLARWCCRLDTNNAGDPVGLLYLSDKNDNLRPDIDDFELFETIANNPYLPDPYKEVMVLRPGVQGTSEIVGEWKSEKSHVFEYLRSNSYIPWGHFAANMANDSIRYTTSALSLEDIQALRHLYYQRTYVTLAQKLSLDLPPGRKRLSTEDMESLRLQIMKAPHDQINYMTTLWGWNFGYDFSSSGYRLHATHQMIHQQYAMVPGSVTTTDDSETMPTYSCGDLVADTVERYQTAYGNDFFSDYLKAIRNNIRTDRKDGQSTLIVWEDNNVILFVPKAQVSQWELQLMVVADGPLGPVGNIVEADTSVRNSIDKGILLAQKIYSRLNTKMVTSLEFPKRIGIQNGQRLFYSFLPKLPWSMGAFSEAQMRYICGHYPEDFAACCRNRMNEAKFKSLLQVK